MALSPNQLAQLAATIDRRHVSLLEEVRDALESSENQQYVELIDRVPADIGDQSVADALADLSLALIDRHVHELRELDAVRARIGDGTLGRCADCGLEIDFERLLAYPTATRCLACQAQHEKTHAQGGTPTL